MRRDLDAVVNEIRRGDAPSVLLIHGDDFRVQSATKTILDQLVPPENRAFNLESFDGQSTPWDRIEAALMTPPFFSGTKVVLIENAPYFLSTDHKGELAENIFQLWTDGKKDEAAKLLSQVFSLEGWTQEQFESSQGSFSSSEFTALFGDGSREARATFDEILAYCRSHRIRVSPSPKGEQQKLTDFLKQGLPQWAILLLTAPHVDRRTRLYKSFDEKKSVLDLTLERDRSGRISREIVADFIDRRLKEAGKKIESQAKEIILMRAGEELWAVHQELEKLLLYVGEDPWIKSKDVEEIFLDHAQGWIFDLTGAIAERDTLRTLSHLDRLLSQGEHPLKLLGTIASEVRRLLAARQLIEGEMRHKWRKHMTYQQFQVNAMQQDTGLLTRSPYGDYMTFTKADNFTSRELLHFLELIYQTDIRLKSSGHSSRMLMERLVLDMCRPQ